MNFEANCRTTAMGIMPHRDIERALGLALSLDIPFWPQLPNVSFCEDMYVQVSEHFPGISVDIKNERVGFDTARFYQELDAYSLRMGQPESFQLTPAYSRVFHRFLEKDLSRCAAIRGQATGPVSFGFRIIDEENKPIIYNEAVRTIVYDFVQRKANVQYRQLKQKNQNAFVWLDEPGLGWVFTGMTGYDDVRAKDDYREFLSGIDGPKALHLCANVNLPYLLQMGVEILSFDSYQAGAMLAGYAEAIGEFLKKENILCWGIVPTDPESLDRETPKTLAERLSDYWHTIVEGAGVGEEVIARQALLAPARCMLKNSGRVGAVDESAPRKKNYDPVRDSSVEEGLVEKAFDYLQEVSGILRRKYGLS